MVVRTAIADERSQKNLYLSRLLYTAIIFGALGLLLLGRYFYLQLVRHEYYSAHSEENRIQIRPVLPVRGLIYDRSGQLLAENRPMLSLMMAPARTPELERTLELLRRLVALREEEIRQFRRLLYRGGAIGEAPLRIGLDERDLARLAANRYRLPGVRVRAQLVRHYPQGERFAHVVGYTGAITAADRRRLDPVQYQGHYRIGKTGLEYFYERPLHGRTGREQVEVNAQGYTQRVLQRDFGQAGRDLHLHLDSELQRVALQGLAGRRGAVVALDTRDGGVLALVSSPSFDPNAFVYGLSARKFAGLRDSRDRPLFNRAVQGQYPPASTLKPVVALAGLYHGVITPEFTIEDPGRYTLGGRVYRDWREEGHGKVNLHVSIAESCDTYYYRLADRLGISPIVDFARFFGLGSATGIDLGGESTGLAPGPAWKQEQVGEPWYAGDTLNVAIGQGYILATPLQLAWLSAKIATRGAAPVPRLVQGTRRPPLLPDTPQIPRWMWEQLRRSMEAVVHDPRGTAHNIAADLDYRIAGKTGTAQLVSLVTDAQGERVMPDPANRNLVDHSLYIGFAPAGTAQIAVAVLVENSGRGALVAAPIARQLFDSWLQRPGTGAGGG